MDARNLAEVFDDVYLREFSEFDGAPRHFFSLRHRRKMDKILYPQGVSSFSANRRLSVKKRVFIAVLVILLSLLGIAAGAQVSKSFAFEDINGHNYLFAVNDKNFPTELVTLYHLPTVPDGFELIYDERSSYKISTWYSDHDGRRVLYFAQSVKNGFNIGLDERYIEETEIGGCLAYYLCPNNNGTIMWDSGTIIWDNKDYILMVDGGFSKDELIAFAESVELKED